MTFIYVPKQYKRLFLGVFMNATMTQLSQVEAVASFNFPPAFQAIRSLYSKRHGDSTWLSLERGRAIITSEDQAEQFLFSFGNMHEAKMKRACSLMIESFNAHKESFNFVDIIDYGCGQALASIVTLNYLQSTGLNKEYIGKTTLIEPSKIALNRAKMFIGSAPSIKAINKELDELNPTDLATDKDAIKLHLFSNILDMGCDVFNIEQLACNIKASQKGINYFLCASPVIGGRVDQRLEHFVEQFHGLSCEIIAHEKGLIRSDKSWTKNIWVFKVDL